MYNTQQNEVEMVTAEGEDPYPTSAEGREGGMPPLHSIPGFFGMPPTLLGLDLDPP